MPDQMQPKQIPNYWDYKALRDEIALLKQRIKTLEDLVRPVETSTPEPLATWPQRVFIMKIATALNMDCANLEVEIDQWTKEQASYWIEHHLPEYNNKTRGWRLGP